MSAMQQPSLNEWNRQKKNKYVLFMPLFFGAIGTGGLNTAFQNENLGTGSDITSQNIDRSYMRINNPTQDLKIPTADINIFSSKEQLDYIRNVFCLNISELADILSVTRPTIYAWMNGAELKPDTSARITKLVTVASYLQGLNITRFDSLLHRPIFDGVSLFHKIKNGEDIKESLQLIQKISYKEAFGRKEKKGSITNRGVSDPSDYSNPFYRD